MLRSTNSVTLCQSSVFFFLQNCLDVKNEVFEKKIAFLVFVFFCVGEIETEKRTTNKMEKAKKPNKNRFFKVVIQKCEKAKKWIFSKNCLTLFVSGREKSAHFRAHLFWPKLFLGPNSVNQEAL